MLCSRSLRVQNVSGIVESDEKVTKPAMWSINRSVCGEIVFGAIEATSHIDDVARDNSFSVKGRKLKAMSASPLQRLRVCCRSNEFQLEMATVLGPLALFPIRQMAVAASLVLDTRTRECHANLGRRDEALPRSVLAVAHKAGRQFWSRSLCRQHIRSARFRAAAQRRRTGSYSASDSFPPQYRNEWPAACIDLANQSLGPLRLRA
jgi:hypothetical protein